MGKYRISEPRFLHGIPAYLANNAHAHRPIWFQISLIALRHDHALNLSDQSGIQMTALRTAFFATAAAALMSTAATAEGPVQAKPTQMRVASDKSTLLHLDRPAKTVIVGNPAIADAQLINERTIYVLGRMFGNTNIIAIDADGGEVINTGVTVGAADHQQVTVYRGPSGQRNLACAPHCERMVMPGDAEMKAMVEDADKKSESGQKAATLASGK
jgi:Flp pilus assembly secretin CpaC